MFIELIALFIVNITLCIVLRIPWKLCLLLFVGVPFIASIIAMIYPVADRKFSLISIDFIKSVIVVFFFAELSFSYMAPLIGSIAYAIARRSNVATRISRGRLASWGVVVGALSGLIVMLAIIFSGQWREPSPGFERELKIVSLIGLVSGAISGLAIALYLPGAIQSDHR